MSLNQKTPRVHVLHLTDNLKVGGVQKVVVNITHALSAAAQTSVAASQEGTLWHSLPATAGKYFAPPRRGVLNILRYTYWLRRTIVTSNCDVVHAHQRGVALIAKIATIGTGVPVVEHVHSIFQSHKLLSFHGDMLIACGSSVANVLLGTYKKNPRKVRTIMNSVPDLASDTFQSIPIVAGSLPRIIGIGRLTDIKDPLRFVRLIAKLNSGDKPIVEAVWLGDGELREKAVNLAHTLNCNGLDFLGNQSDVATYIRNADLLLMTSRREGLPLAILETMALGRGIIAPAIGSCGDAVIDGENGLLYDPESDLSTLADAVRHALTPATLQAWGTKSRELYLQNFHPSTSIPALLEVYRTAMSDSSRRWSTRLRLKGRSLLNAPH